MRAPSVRRASGEHSSGVRSPAAHARRRDVGRRLALGLVAAAVAAHGLGVASSGFAQQRSLGLDVSAWQGNLSQTTWNNFRTLHGREFVFLRSSRGGTTGYYDQNDAANANGNNTLSQRYDDPYFVQNITRATLAGMYAGPYHFARPDVVATTTNSGGVANSGADEADHFLQMAGAWMRPGYLLPVFDLEAGQTQRSANELAQFAIDFSNRIHGATGVRPVMYINGNYAAYLQSSSATLRNQVVAAFPALWTARYANQTNPDAIPIQTGHPKDTYSAIYGPWDDAPRPVHPWAFWQYASTVRLSSYNNGNSNLDGNVAQGGREFVKDRLVPALWLGDGSGDWSDLTRWNSGQTPTAPVQGTGQVPRVGALTLPTPRLPGIDDTVVLDRSGAAPTIALSSGTQRIRKLYARERLQIVGGTLEIGYVPSGDSTSFSAQISAPLEVLDGGTLSVHTLLVDAQQRLELGNATLAFSTIQLAPHAAAPAEIFLTGDVALTPLSNAAAAIGPASGAGSPGRFNLGGAERALFVADGTAATDVTISAPLINGGLVKTGPGTLALLGANAYQGPTRVSGGTLRLAAAALADAADVLLADGGTLELGFTGAPDVIGALFIDGQSQPAGSWGPVGSTAQFTSSRIAGSGILQVTEFVAPPLAGDFNGDGVADGADLLEWQRGNSPQPYSAADLDQWHAAFGAQPAAAPSSSAAPEPASLVGGLLAAALAAGCRPLGRPARRRRPPVGRQSWEK